MNKEFNEYLIKNKRKILKREYKFFFNSINFYQEYELINYVKYYKLFNNYMNKLREYNKILYSFFCVTTNDNSIILKIQKIKKFVNLDLKYLNDYFAENKSILSLSYFYEIKQLLETLTLHKELEESLENKQKEKKRVKI